MPEPSPGQLVWVALDPTMGREQNGRRPAVVISSRGHLSVADTLAVIVPVTSVDRGWSNHIPLRGTALDRPSWAMTEQIRTIPRQRIVRIAGEVDAATLGAIRQWAIDFIDE